MDKIKEKLVYKENLKGSKQSFSGGFNRPLLPVRINNGKEVDVLIESNLSEEEFEELRKEIRILIMSKIYEE